MKGDRQRCIAAGMDDYISKPIRIQNLHESLAGLSAPPANESNSRHHNDPKNESESMDKKTVFDLQTALENTGGDRELLAELCDVFDEEYPGLTKSIQDGISSGDARAIHRAAHSLKGAVTPFAAKAVYQAAWKLEETTAEGDVSNAAELFENLNREIERFRNAIRQSL